MTRVDIGLSSTSEISLPEWLQVAQPGDQFEYCRGDLSRTRASIRRCMHTNHPILNDAKLAAELAKTGEFHLVQRKYGEGDFAYIIVKGTAVQMNDHSRKVESFMSDIRKLQNKGAALS